MILVDANLLIYAYNKSSDQHQNSKDWLDMVLNGVPKVGLPWNSLLAFARIVTNHRIFETPSSPERAWDQVIKWTQAPAAWIPQETEHHAEIIRKIVQAVSIDANDLPDVHLAALAVEHGLKIYSTDSDFLKYPGIELINPLNKNCQ
jgi:hypothetical protein